MSAPEFWAPARWCSVPVLAVCVGCSTNLPGWDGPCHEDGLRCGRLEIHGPRWWLPRRRVSRTGVRWVRRRGGGAYDWLRYWFITKLSRSLSLFDANDRPKMEKQQVRAVDVDMSHFFVSACRQREYGASGRFPRAATLPCPPGLSVASPERRVCGTPGLPGYTGCFTRYAGVGGEGLHGPDPRTSADPHSAQ